MGLGCVHAFGEPAPAVEYSDHRILTYSDMDMLKNWALSRCIGAITKDKATRDDAYATAGAYFEFAEYSLETYGEIKEIVSRYVRKKYSGSIPSEFNTMKCIDMYHGKELDEFVRTVTERAKARMGEKAKTEAKARMEVEARIEAREKARPK